MAYAKTETIDATTGGDTVKQAVIKNDDNMTVAFTSVNAQLTKTTAIELKTDYISVTQAVNLDTMETNIGTNNAKATYPGSASSTELNILDGATVTTAELNILDGVTSTATELNYVDGVTSAIQTQMDTKLANSVEDTTPQLGGELDGNDKQYVDMRFKENGIGSTGSTATLDCSAYNHFTLEPTANLIINFTNMKVGRIVVVELKGGGDHTLTWQVGGADTNFKWAGGSAPTLSTTTGVDFLVFIADGTNSLAGGMSLKGVS